MDAPQRSDVILVLAGETDRRPVRALELLAQGYGRKVIINVPAGAKVYGSNEVELAQQYFKSLPQAAAISVCPIEGLSTKEEAKDAEKCLQRVGAKSVLIVTSDFHTRRARTFFAVNCRGWNSLLPPRVTIHIWNALVDSIANGRKPSWTNGCD